MRKLTKALHVTDKRMLKAMADINSNIQTELLMIELAKRKIQQFIKLRTQLLNSFLNSKGVIINDTHDVIFSDQTGELMVYQHTPPTLSMIDE